ncbi:MAG: hypothetical protein LBT48_08895, partial [Prevotellaceae bacterium]|nr:hypothetical protein [Prevotellaceae bacterium]
YDLEIDRSTLSKEELNLFEELDTISSRYSPYEEERLLDERAFTNEKQLKEKILEAYTQLSLFRQDSTVSEL